MEGIADQPAQEEVVVQKTITGLQLTPADQAARAAWLTRYRELLVRLPDNRETSIDAASAFVADCLESDGLEPASPDDNLTNQENATSQSTPAADNMPSVGQGAVPEATHVSCSSGVSVPPPKGSPDARAELRQLRGDLIEEKSRHRKAQERLHQLEGKMLEMQAAVLMASPGKKRIGGSSAMVYGEALPLPRISPKRSRSVCLSPLKTKPTRSTTSSPGSSGVTPISKRASAPNFFRPAENGDFGDDMQGMSRSARHKARIELITKRQSSTASTWELRRAEKSDRMQQVYAFGDHLWDSFLDWKETSHSAV
jgi:hypothetical protein